MLPSIRRSVLLVVMAGIGLSMQATALAATNELSDADIQAQIRDKYLVILFADRDFEDVKREAEKISRACGVQFSMNGHIWDKSRGLILPDNCDDPIYCGQYFPRRYNELDLAAANPADYISVEKSAAYPNLQKDYYIALGAICESREEATKEMGKLKPFAPTAYVAKTRIYMGCMH